MIIERHYLYADREDVYLTRYGLEDVGPRPAIVIAPGGSYMNISIRESEPIALAFAQRGYQTFVLNYSVYFQSRTRPADLTGIDFAEKTHSHFPAPMHEIAYAFQMIHKHAVDWNVETKKIGLIGFSAGGHNVATYGNQWSKEIAEATGISADILEPAFQILAYPLIDYANLADVASKMSSEEAVYLTTLFQYTLGSMDLSRKELEAWSPNYNVNDRTPPTFIWGTAEDTRVAARDFSVMALALQDAGRPVELHLYAHGDHGLSLANRHTAKNKEQIRPDVATWLTHAESFVQKYAPVEGVE